MNNKYLLYAALIVVGAVLADRIRSLPVLNKLPSI